MSTDRRRRPTQNFTCNASERAVDGKSQVYTVVYNWLCTMCLLQNVEPGVLYTIGCKINNSIPLIFFFNSVVVAHFPSLATVMFNCLPNRQLVKSKRALRPLHIFQFSNSNLAIAMQIITAHIHNYPTYAAYMFD